MNNSRGSVGVLILFIIIIMGGLILWDYLNPTLPVEQMWTKHEEKIYCRGLIIGDICLGKELKGEITK